ncbi:hypothetical protein B0H16DRAFT_1861519 [Mycena metata]|uniref:Uncharacterized protein n=1 Tax=Mycena metata TaxID=1033252 RepID=A0AAD7IGW3_9AGAR|nr:hypothetical protein B0H16DRAFT_1861519 [Mycena metata]
MPGLCPHPSTSTSSLFGPTSTFTPYAEPNREPRGTLDLRRGKQRGDACDVGVVFECEGECGCRAWRDGDDAGYCRQGVLQPAQQSYKYVPPSPSTVVQYPPRYSAQIAAASASSNNSGSQHHQHGHQQTTRDTILGSVALRSRIPAPAARALDNEPARVAVQAPARVVFARGTPPPPPSSSPSSSSASSTATTVTSGGGGYAGSQNQVPSQYPPDTLTARSDYANAGHSGVVSQPQYLSTSTRSHPPLCHVYRRGVPRRSLIHTRQNRHTGS